MDNKMLNTTKYLDVKQSLIKIKCFQNKIKKNLKKILNLKIIQLKLINILILISLKKKIMKICW